MQVRFDRHDTSPSKRHLTPGKVYEVHAVSVFSKTTHVQIVDDVDTPIFLPSHLFLITESSIPGDWICNLFPGSPVELVFGPAFMAADTQSYDAMVDHESAAVTRFWDRLDRRARTAEDDPGPGPDLGRAS